MKHAFLIIAHNNFYILEKLIQMLDHDKNDIFIHIDCKCVNFNFEYYKKLTRHSSVAFIEKRRNVRWGTFSQVEVEIELFRTARESDDYAYYHLLSGVDLPIKSMEYIHAFLQEHKGNEFVNINNDFDTYKNLKYQLIGWEKIRISKLWIFPDAKKENNYFLRLLKRVLSISFLLLQKILFYDHRKRFKLEYGKGSNWVSITHSLVEHILENSEIVESKFKRSYCPDEHFIQSLIISSKVFKDNVYHEGNLRYIDWKRGNPYIFQDEDFEDLCNSNKLFARKFDEGYKNIVDKIYDTFCKE